MAPFWMPTTGFCMVFRCGTLVCSCPGTQLWTPDPRFGSRRVPAGPGTFFGQKWGPEKYDFVEEMVPREVLWGSVRGDWIVGCPGGLWARPFPPKPYQKIILQGFPHFLKKSLGLHGGSLLSLCGGPSSKVDHLKNSPLIHPNHLPGRPWGGIL